MAGCGGNNKRFQYCADPSGQEILYLRALQGHSRRNLIDPSLQDNVLIPNDFFEYTCHIGCAINLHSVTNSGLIPGGQNLSTRQTVFFRSVDPMNKEHRDPNKIDLEAPRLAWYKQKNGRNMKTRCVGSTLNLLNRKDLSSIKHDRTKSSFTTHSQLVVSRKTIMMENGEIIYEKVFASPLPPPKVSFKDNWMKELGSEFAGGSEDSKQTQLKSKTQLLSTGRPVKSEQPSGSLS